MCEELLYNILVEVDWKRLDFYVHVSFIVSKLGACQIRLAPVFSMTLRCFATTSIVVNILTMKQSQMVCVEKLL